MANLKKGRLVSNTGPIIALMLLGKLEILRELFDEVIVQRMLKGADET